MSYRYGLGMRLDGPPVLLKRSPAGRVSSRQLPLPMIGGDWSFDERDYREVVAVVSITDELNFDMSPALVRVKVAMNNGTAAQQPLHVFLGVPK